MKRYSQFVLNEKSFEDHLKHLQPGDQKDQRDKLAAKARPEDVHVAQVLPTRVPEKSSNLNTKLNLWCKLSKQKAVFLFGTESTLYLPWCLWDFLSLIQSGSWQGGTFFAQELRSR